MKTREIEFRVWDVQRHKFLNHNGASYYENDDGNWIGLPACLTYPDLYTVQQFTGLIDKNEKPVFEGDIISGSAVEYVTELASFGVIRKGIGWTPLGNLFTSRYSPTIIGNNMENPELIIT